MRSTTSAISRISLLLGLFVAASCGGGGDGGPTPPPPVESVASVDLSSSTVDIAPGATSQLQATARSSSGAALSGRSFSWTSVQPSVATVSASGLVTGVADGTTTVTVTSEGRTASATINVRTPVAAVVVTPQTAQITVGGTPSQLTAVARDANGAALTGRTIAWSSSSVGVATVSQTGLVTAVAAGTTTISATSEGRTGTATITSVTNPCSTVRPLAIGATFNGTLTAADCKLPDNTAFQAFTFTVTTSRVLEIEMSSAAVDPYLLVLDDDDDVVGEDDDSGAGSGARVLRVFAPGVYYIIANTYDANSFGAYAVSIKDAPAACSSTRPTTLPFTLTATLNGNNSCRLNDDSFLDRYDLNLTSVTKMRLDMTSTVLDPYLYILDQNGSPVAQDDDNGAGLNARIDISLQPGRYIVLASAQPQQTGPYTLNITPAVDPCAVNRTIVIGTPQNLTLTANDCAVGAQGPMRLTQRFLLNVATAGPLQVDMVSSQIDPYIIIQSATTGAILAEHDDIDPGVNRNARIAANFPAGQYIINTTTFDDSLANTQVGAYSLSVAAIVPTTPVTITVTPTTLPLAAGQQQQLTATVTASANTAVTWTSSDQAVATVSSTGLVRGVTPGTATITVRPAADPTKSATVAVTVTQTQAGNPNLDIAAMYLIQSVQQLDNSVKLVANRDAVARVYLRGSRTGIGASTVRVRAYQGNTLLQTFTANVNPTLTVDESCCSANIAIPGSLIRAGVSILADADPNNAVTESNETDNTFPLNGTPLALNVTTVPDFNITLVPIRQNRSGQLGVANASVLNTLRSVWPLGTVNLRTRTTPLAIDYALVSTSFDEWSFLVRDLETARRADPQAQYYYGLVRVSYTSGVLGLAGGIPALSAVGVDEGSSFGATEAKYTLAHEMGHTIGLRHAPCGGAAGPDPAFPFNDGRSGAFGLDIASGNVVKAPNGTDIMGYCDNQWVSVYNYRNVFDIRARNPNGVPASMTSVAAPTSVLMVTGGVDTQSATIDGSFAMTATPTKYDPAGRFVLEGFGANGKVLFTHRFSPFAVSDGKPGDEGFVVGVPVSEAMKSEVVRVAVREVNGSRKSFRVRSAVTQPSATANSNIISATRATTGKMSLKWATNAAPMVMVRNPANGEVIGIGRTGDLDLSQFETFNAVELLVTDGVSSVRRSVNPKTGAIRQ